MSTWTSRRLAVLAAALAVAAGPAAADGSAPLRMAVQGRAVVIAGPSGYCVDRGPSADGPGGAFVLLASCAALGGGRAAPAGTPAILTATVAAATAAEPAAARFAELAGFFQTEAGRAVLSRRGDARSVRLVEAFSRDGVLFLRIEDSAVFPEGEVEPGYWRAVLSLRGRVVTLAVMGHARRPLPAAEARSLIADFAQQVQSANPPR